MKYLILSFLSTLICCQPSDEKTTKNMQSDPHSFSEPDKAKVTHLRWDAEVDFRPEKN